MSFPSAKICLGRASWLALPVGTRILAVIVLAITSTWILSIVPIQYSIGLVISALIYFVKVGAFRPNRFDVALLLALSVQVGWVSLGEILDGRDPMQTRYFRNLPSSALYLLTARVAISGIRLSEWLTILMAGGQPFHRLIWAIVGITSTFARLPFIQRYRKCRKQAMPRRWTLRLQSSHCFAPLWVLEIGDSLQECILITFSGSFAIDASLGTSPSVGEIKVNRSEDLYCQHMLDAVYERTLGVRLVTPLWQQTLHNICDNGSRILDLGAGAGRLLPTWRRIREERSVHVTMLEANISFFETLNRRVLEHDRSWLKAEHGWFGDGPLPSFDVVVLHQNTFLELLAFDGGVRDVIRSLHRVVASGGILVFDFTDVGIRKQAGATGCILSESIEGIGKVDYSYAILHSDGNTVQARLRLNCSRSDGAFTSARWEFRGRFPSLVEVIGELEDFFSVAMNSPIPDFMGFYPGDTHLLLCRKRHNAPNQTFVT